MSIVYSDKTVGKYQPDFTIDDKIILEIKAVEYLPKKLATQLVYYLKGTDFKLGYLVNFGAPNLQIIRKVWSREFITR